MSTVIVNHRVTEYNTWKKGFDAGKALRTANDVTEIAVGRKLDDANMAYLIFDVKDVDKMFKMFSDPQLQKAMQDSGVIGKPEIVVIEQ